MVLGETYTLDQNMFEYVMGWFLKCFMLIFSQSALIITQVEDIIKFQLNNNVNFKIKHWPLLHYSVFHLLSLITAGTLEL